MSWHSGRTRSFFAVVSMLFGAIGVRHAHAKTPSEPTPPRKNVLGGPLEPCCTKIRAGFFRDGYCRMSSGDAGRHVVCAVMTESFLAFTREQGNDLSTPQPMAAFPGLRAGDRWCLCASRWRQALEADRAPKVDLGATDEEALRIVSLEALQKHDANR